MTSEPACLVRTMLSWTPCSTRAAPSAPRAWRTASSDRAAAGHATAPHAAAILAPFAALDVFRAQLGIAIGTVAARRAPRSPRCGRPTAAAFVALRTLGLIRTRRTRGTVGAIAAAALAIARSRTTSLRSSPPPGLRCIRGCEASRCRRAFDRGGTVSRRSGDAVGGCRHAVGGGAAARPRPARLAARPRFARRARRTTLALRTARPPDLDHLRLRGCRRGFGGRRGSAVQARLPMRPACSADRLARRQRPRRPALPTQRCNRLPAAQPLRPAQHPAQAQVRARLPRPAA